MSLPANTQILANLLALPQEQRDDAWVGRFFAAVPDTPLQMLEPQIQLGPDGYPYFQLAIPAADDVPLCTLSQALDHCLDHGLGAVVFKSPGRADEPGWVFSYAHLFSYSLFRSFVGDPNQTPPAPEDAQTGKDRQILLMSPSETFLPLRVRRAMTDFFRKVIGMENPKMKMIVEPGQFPASGLMFNLSAQDFGGDEDKHGRALNALHWYLPPSYCAILKKPADWDGETFDPLSPG